MRIRLAVNLCQTRIDLSPEPQCSQKARKAHNPLHAQNHAPPIKERAGFFQDDEWKQRKKEKHTTPSPFSQRFLFKGRSESMRSLSSFSFMNLIPWMLPHDGHVAARWLMICHLFFFLRTPR